MFDRSFKVLPSLSLGSYLNSFLKGFGLPSSKRPGSFLFVASGGVILCGGRIGVIGVVGEAWSARGFGWVWIVGFT